MTDTSEAARLFIARERVALVLDEAANAKDEIPAPLVRTVLASAAQSITIDWSTGQRAIFTDNVIPFPKM